ASFGRSLGSTARRTGELPNLRVIVVYKEGISHVGAYTTYRRTNHHRQQYPPDGRGGKGTEGAPWYRCASLHPSGTTGAAHRGRRRRFLEASAETGKLRDCIQPAKQGALRFQLSRTMFGAPYVRVSPTTSVPTPRLSAGARSR